jgi:hypothetical protein
MLDEREKEIIKTVMSRNDIKATNNVSFDRFMTNYFQQENFMICTISLDGTVITAGVAKRNPIDKFFAIVGMNRSFNAALKNLF